MKYQASYTSGSDSNTRYTDLGIFETKEDAIDACITAGFDEDDDFDDEEPYARESLNVRGYYCVGYSTLCLQIDEVQ